MPRVLFPWITVLLAVAATASGQSSDHRWWTTNEYLMWWIQPASVPIPIVSQIRPESISEMLPGQGVPGAIGTPGTEVVLGDEHMGMGDRAGGRFTLGYWLDDAQTVGVEGSYFFVGEESASRRVSSDGGPNSPVLGLPYYDVNSTALIILGAPIVFADVPGESFVLTASPEFMSGNHTLVLANRLQGLELNLVANRRSSQPRRLDLLAGLRWLQFDEEHRFTADSTIVAEDFLTGLNVRGTDLFDARNDFYGPQVGVRAEFQAYRLSLQLLGKVALGDMHEVVDVAGETQITPPFPDIPPVEVSGAFGAQPSNMGHHSRDTLAVIPEIGVRLAYPLNDRLRVFMAYDFLFASNVVRPSQQVDHAGNANRAPLAEALDLGGEGPTGPLRPAFAFNNTSLWTQGINFGFELRR